MYGFESYVPLWCKSNFSFLEGASHPDELVDEVHRLGLRAIALTDVDGVYGVVRAHIKAKELGVKLIVGSQITIVGGTQIILLVRNKTGYRNLCRIISAGRLASPKGQSRVTWRTICLHANGLIALWGGDNSLLLDESANIRSLVFDLKDAFGGDLFAMVSRHKTVEETRQEKVLFERAKEFSLPLVATTEVLYHVAARRPLQDVLTCLRHNATLTSAGCLTNSNGEHYVRSAISFARMFSDIPQAVRQSDLIGEACDFSLDQLEYRYPSEVDVNGGTSFERLERLTFEGANQRYGAEIPLNVSKQVKRELSLINELDYPGYFLTMYEIVSFCKEREILCQGRGSAANSVVCFCLGITAIDPVRMDLLFERFISRERREPPDIDLDIEHNRREEVIQHVYGKYGRTHAAMVAVVIRYRPKSAVRDVGKVLGIPEASLHRLSKLLSRYGHLPQEVMVQAGFDTDVPAHMQLFALAGEILDFPRHLSIHPGGFVLGGEPIENLVPVENATMVDRTVIQWDKDDVEALGLFKVDLLGLGALSHLHLCFDLLKKTRSKTLSMASIPPNDKETFDMICKGDTIGVFQIESRAQMAMLPRLRPRDFYDLVIQVSIVRPGPITGGMVHPYLKRRHGIEKVVYPHTCLEPVLKKTLGVPLFQEQVMKLAIIAADYTPGEADQLRRDMGAWKKSGRIERHRERLISRMKLKGIDAEFAERVFEQIRGFGEYGFPESHAASFALISYATAYMRCHYPTEFTCSLLNALPMGFYMPSTLVEDAKRNGVTVLPVDVNQSEWFCTIPMPPPNSSPVGATLRGCPSSNSPSLKGTIRMGLRHIKGLGIKDWEKMQRARNDGVFRSVSDFSRRTRLDSRVLEKLSKGGAFVFGGVSRRQALWETKGHGRAKNDSLVLEHKGPKVPFDDLGPFDTIAWDYDIAGHSTRGHPLGPLRDQLQEMGIPDAQEIAGMKHGQRTQYAGMVICRQRPSTASGVVFMTLEDETGLVNLVCWRDIFERHKILAKTTPFLGVTGHIQTEDGVTHLIAADLWRPALTLRPVGTQSRDFK